MTEYPETPKSTEDPRGKVPEDVWSYRGYHLRSSEFVTAMVHYFRAEISRANVWRQRLDNTTNWAVITTAASITVAFSQGEGHHGVILLDTLLVMLFLVIEARRYRYYEVWSSRIRLMETDFFAAMLVPPFGPSPDWAESLADNLLQPHYPISTWEALGRRLRRNYLYIFGILILAWVARVALIPTTITGLPDLYQRAALGSIPGEVMLALGVVFTAFWLGVALLTIGMHEASGEVLPRFQLGDTVTLEAQQGQKRWQAWFRHPSRRRQLMAMVITDDTQPVAQAVMKELKRGVTMLPGTGMYTGNPRPVLLCALTATEVSQLKGVVSRVDPKAFVIVIPAQEVLGVGFNPLKTEK